MRPKVKFKDFLVARCRRHDATGDFARMAVADTKLPDFTRWDDLDTYLERTGRLKAVEAARTVWMEYQDYRRDLMWGRRF